MSLFFVSKTIQTTRDDGVFEETPVITTTTSSLNDDAQSQPYIPLAEQLRTNQERAAADRIEHERTMQRSATGLLLDEEDCAHLQALEQHKRQQKAAEQEETLHEVAAYRMARAERLFSHQQEEQKTVEFTSHETKKTKRRHSPSDLIDVAAPQSSMVDSRKASGTNAFFPKVIVTKKKLRVEKTTDERDEPCPKGTTTSMTANLEIMSSLPVEPIISFSQRQQQQPQQHQELHDCNDILMPSSSTMAPPSNDVEGFEDEHAVDEGQPSQDGTSSLGGLLLGYGSSSDDGDD